MQLLEDRVGGGGPAKWLGVVVVVRDELVDALDKLLHAGERASTDCLVSDQREEAFDLIEPGTVGRDEMHMPARPSCQPGLDLRMTVRGVVVDNAVHVQLG